MKNLYFTILSLAIPAIALAELQPEQVRNQKAVYDEAAHAVVVSGQLPTTCYDSEYYIYEELDHISEVLLERHTPGTSWPANSVVGKLTSQTPGADFSFTDTDVESDAKYEYRITCYVDGIKGYSGYANVYTGVTPGKLEAFEAYTTSPDATAISFRITAPSTSVSGLPLESLSAIDIELYSDFSYTLLHSIENPVPGETYGYVHEGLQSDKTYYYRARARKGATGWSESVEAQAYVGVDLPAAPANPTVAEYNDDSVTLTWHPVTAGVRGGSVYPENVYYQISRRLLDGEVIDLGYTAAGATSYVDRHGYKEETWIEYIITPANESGIGYNSAELPGVVTGAPVSLPFAESFSYGSFDHKGWTRHSTQDDPYYTYVAWNSGASSTVYHWGSDSYIYIDSQDSDLGFAYCLFYSYSPDGQTEGLVSPRIAVGDAKELELSFFFFDFDAESSGNRVAASYCDDSGVWTPIFSSEPDEDTLPGWNEVKVNFALQNPTEHIRLRMEAIRGGIPIIDAFIDNILLKNADESGVGTLNAETIIPGNAELFTIDGRRVNDNSPAPGLYIRTNGNKTEKILIK